MTVKDSNICRNIWFHQDKPSKDFAVITLVIGIVSFIAVLFLRMNAESVICTLLLITIVTLSVCLAQTKTLIVEIDRDKGAVNKTVKYFAFAMRKSYPLQEFDGVKLLAKDGPTEEGYRIHRYSVVLAGRRRSLELLTADSEAEIIAIQKELAEFLGLPA